MSFTNKKRKTFNLNKNKINIFFFLSVLVLVFGLMGYVSAMWNEQLKIEEIVNTGYMEIQKEGDMIITPMWKSYSVDTLFGTITVRYIAALYIELPIRNTGTVPAKVTNIEVSLCGINILVDGVLENESRIVNGLDPGERAYLKLDRIWLENLNVRFLNAADMNISLKVEFEQWNTSNKSGTAEGEGWSYLLEYNWW